MRITIASILMTVLWFSLATCLWCLILAKSKEYQVELIGVLLLFSLLRLFLPLSSRTGLAIDSKYIYPTVLAWLRGPLSGQFTVGEVLLFLWAAVALIRLALLFGRLVKQNRFWLQMPRPTEGSRLPVMVWEIGRAMGYHNNVELAVSSSSVTAYQVGFFHPRILLPHNVEGLSQETVDSILRHELGHFLGGDLWIKLGVQILSCALWWNPVMPFLSRSVEQLLELRCDRRACRDLTDEARLSYAGALLQVIQNNPPAKQKVSLGFLGASEDARIVQRFQMLLMKKPDSVSKGKIVAIVAVCVILFIGSYYVELQPGTAPETDDMSGYVAISPETAWLVRAEDGSIQLYVEGEYFTALPEEALSGSPIRDLKIYEGDVPK